MLLREDGDAVVAIGQASHAWLSGQLARAWGAERFPAPDPFEEVCLGAEQHDVGMAHWDLAPELNPVTGRPRQFFEVPRPTHVALWTAAPARVLTQSRYAALLVSLHGTGLYERFPPGDDPGVRDLVREYLASQRVLQERLAEEVGASPDELRRNQGLLAAWDDLSLALCMGSAARDVPDVPAAQGTATLRLARHDDHHTLDPWPFAAGELRVRCEGRRLDGRYADERELHAALERAPRVDLRFTLRPA
jgi:Protein of unknown function (DUF3891)